ncbi:MAG: bile acid:sodium symporter family protein [Pseudomonadota bacterium]|jgi:BASS family bile acid:Na+ symporter|nr:bile acid:sodium symporter family protein [Pseudomonadota bacterium]
MDIVQFFYVEVIPIGLWLIMFGLGMSLTLGDIKHVFVDVKAATIGLAGQLILLPALGFLLVEILSPAPAIAVGLIILTACPGGVTSNAYVFASRGDLALSVSLTGISSFITVFTIPIWTFLALDLYYTQGSSPEIPVLDMVYQLASLTIIPIAGGMIVRFLKPEFAKRLVETLRTVTLIFLITLVVSGTITSFSVLIDNFIDAALIALLLNVFAMAMGFTLGRFFKLDLAKRVSITYEVGVQNITLAFLVTLSLLQEPSLAVSTLVYALFMKITALTFLTFARKWIKQDAARVKGMNMI